MKDSTQETESLFV